MVAKPVSGLVVLFVGMNIVVEGPCAARLDIKTPDTPLENRTSAEAMSSFSTSRISAEPGTGLVL